MLGKPSEIHRFQLQNHRIYLANPYDFEVNTYIRRPPELSFRNPKQKMSRGVHISYGKHYYMWLHSSGQIGTIIPLNLNLKGIFFVVGGGFPCIRNPPHLGWPTGGLVARCKPPPLTKQEPMFLCLSLSHSIHVCHMYLHENHKIQPNVGTYIIHGYTWIVQV